MSHAIHGRRGRRETVVAGLILVATLAAGSALRFVGLSLMGLIGDESYYWLWSRRPAWAYYDHPAGVALLVRASTGLGGETPWGVRWLNAAIGLASVILTWIVGKQLLSRRAGLLSAAAVAVGAPYLITSRFVYTNALTMFCTLLNLLAFWRMTQEEASVADGLGFGLTLALLFNTRYSAYVYALALGAALLLDHRHLLRTTRLWVAVAVGALGLVPVFAWNAAHDWASFRWQFSHLTESSVHDVSLVGRVHHTLAYVTVPLVLLSAAGLGRIHSAAERLLTLVAMFLLIPIALGPINSPRNLSTGLIPLLLLAGTRWPRDLTAGVRRATAALFGILLLGTGLFGAGTVVSLTTPSPLPHSSIVSAIRRDAAGWEALGAVLGRGSGPIFALDYSIAAQIHYHTGRPAFTAWGQYRLWGIPPLEDTTIVALDYVDPGFVTERLHQAFEHVDGPERLSFEEPGARKVVHVWHVRGLKWDQEAFLRRFDFLTLLEEAS